VTLERRGRGRRRCLAPDRVDQRVGGDDRPGPAGQQSQCRALFRAAELDRGGTPICRNRPEQANLDLGRRSLDGPTLVDR